MHKKIYDKNKVNQLQCKTIWGSYALNEIAYNYAKFCWYFAPRIFIDDYIFIDWSDRYESSS